MATVVGALSVDLAANSAAFAQDLGKARGALGSFSARANRMLAGLDKGFGKLGKSTGRSIKNFVGLKSGIAALIGAGSAGGLLVLIKNSIATADSIAKVADKVGISTKSLQEYRFAAKLAGVEQNTLDLGLQRFVRRVGEAAQGGGELKDTLAQYNIQLRDANGRQRSINAIIDDFADAVQGAESKAEQLRLVFKGFDSEAAALVNLFRLGSAGLKEFRRQANDLGIVMGERLVRQAERAKTEMDILGQVVRTNVTRAFVGFVPQIVRVSAKLKEAVPLVVKFVDAILPASAASSKELSKRIADLEQQASKLMATLSDIEGDGGARQTMLTDRSKIIEGRIAKFRKLREQAVKEERTISKSLNVTIGGRRVGQDAERAKIFDAFQKATAKNIDSIRAETKAIGASEGVRARILAMQRIDTQLKEKNLLLTPAQTQALATQLAVLEKVTTQQVAADKAQERLKDQQAATTSAFRNMGSAAGNALTEIVVRGGDARQVLAGLLQTLSEMIFKLTVINQLEKALGGKGGGGFVDLVGSALGALFGGGGGVNASAARAIGSVAPAASAGIGFAKGGSAIVAGRGGTDANRVNLNLTKGERVDVLTREQQRVTMGPAVTITQSFDFRGADTGVFAKAAQFKEEIVEETKNAVFAAINAGGTAARTVGRRPRR